MDFVLCNLIDSIRFDSIALCSGVDGTWRDRCSSRRSGNERRETILVSHRSPSRLCGFLRWLVECSCLSNALSNAWLVRPFFSSSSVPLREIDRSIDRSIDLSQRHRGRRKKRSNQPSIRQSIRQTRALDQPSKKSAQARRGTVRHENRFTAFVAGSSRGTPIAPRSIHTRAQRNRIESNRINEITQHEIHAEQKKPNQWGK
mmetsp:Transcript_20331/g.42378  ORF Transcript_20331/g.42378 Transcript_20331/m.42378 type:complete len:202 (-) Transcript_20331:767-1372(-)